MEDLIRNVDIDLAFEGIPCVFPGSWSVLQTPGAMLAHTVITVAVFTLFQIDDSVLNHGQWSVCGGPGQ